MKNVVTINLAIATRADIAFAVSNAAKFSAQPAKQHWTAVKRILCYLRGTVNLGLVFAPHVSGGIVGYSDADWGGDTSDRKSTSGYLFQVCGAAVSWRSKKQTCVALSMADAEWLWQVLLKWLFGWNSLLLILGLVHQQKP